MESVLEMMSIVNTSDFPEILNIFKTETSIFVTVKVHYVHVCVLYFEIADCKPKKDWNLMSSISLLDKDHLHFITLEQFCIEHFQFAHT